MSKRKHVHKALAVVIALTCVFPTAHAQVLFTNLAGLQAGNIRDGEALVALETALKDLGAMPKSSMPTILQIQSVDSRYALPSNSSGAARLKDQTDLIVGTLARLDAPESILLATQWGTPQNRLADGQMMGREAPIFPRTDEELAASGLGWLTERDGFTLEWDDDGGVAALTATRSAARGMEFLGAVRMVLCADNEHILGWARSQRQWRPTAAALGRFVEACAKGEFTGLSADYQLPAEFLSKYDLTGTWFAVLILDAFSQPVAVSKTPGAARTVLEAANAPIPLFLAAGEALTEDYETVVPAEEHRAALAGLGVEVDAGLSDALPDWVYDFATHPATTLVIFDDSGRAVAHFAATPSNPTEAQNLQQWMTLHGLF